MHGTPKDIILCNIHVNVVQVALILFSFLVLIFSGMYMFRFSPDLSSNAIYTAVSLFFFSILKSHHTGDEKL